MKSKISIIAILYISIAYTASAQTSDAEAEAIINLLGVQRTEAIRQLVYVTGKDSVTFWKLYDQYQKENKKTSKARIRLYERTALSYDKMTPAVADSLAVLYFANRVDQEKMLQSYYTKIKTATNAVVAFEFYQAEVYILTQIRAHIMQQIPTYGELHMLAKRNEKGRP
jgi:hypothetical protein